jgi:cyanophycinase
VALFAFSATTGISAEPAGPARGTLLIDGGGATDAVRDRFVALSGGAAARVVAFPTGASSLRFGDGNTILDPDWPRDRSEWSAYELYLKKWLGAPNVTILHTRDRGVADSKSFVAPIDSASAVFLGAGNAGRYAAAYLGTRTQRALEALLARGGVVFGTSAGAIIQGSYVVRGRPDKPLLMVSGHDRGFGFLKHVAINPHLTSAKRDAELVNVVDAQPRILGIGIDDDAAIVVRGDRFEVIGTGRVAIYDNTRRDGAWYYWLNSGDRFDLVSRRKVDP